jgi:uncharacterized surface anchored protein
MKRIISIFLVAIMLLSSFSFVAFAEDGDPLDENGDTGGTSPGGNGGLNDYWTNAWQGMRITIIDVTDTADILNGTIRGKVASGTVSVDITNLDASSGFFTRTLAGDNSTALTYGNKVTHFGLVSKMEYRDGDALATIVGNYSFRTVTGLPSLMGSTQASAQTIKDYINNQAMLTQIASWCGVSSYDELISGKYKILAEPVLYSLAGTYKYAFTATEAALFKPHGNSVNWSLINNTLANAFFLEHDELGWYNWTGSTNINQPFQTIIDSLGMHIYSIAPDAPPKSVKIIKKSDTGESLSGAKFTVVGNGKNETITVNGTLTLDLDGWANGSYIVTETVAPTGFVKDATPQTFTINADSVSPTELTFINSPTPPPKSVKILKKSDTGAPLSGAQFTVVGSGKNETITVNGTLTLDLDGWANGTYTVTETVAPSGYTLNAKPQTFTISDSSVSPAELTFINTFTPPPPVEVEFKKVEYGTEIGLAGAVFKVTQLSHWERHLIDPDGNDLGEFYDDDNGDALNAGEPGYHHNVEDLGDDQWKWLEIRETEIVGTFVSGKDGSIPVGALETGSYTIEEITAPAGYALADNVNERIQFFDIPREGGYTVKIVFGNKKLPGLTVLKVDEDTGLPLSGAEFSVKFNGNIVFEGVTDASGVVNVSGYPAGWYEVTELAAPHGYLISTEKKSVYIANGDSAQLKFDNRRKPTLELLKLDAQTGQPLSGAKFKVWKTEGGTVSEYVTGSDGKVTIENLDDVIYSVEEILAPAGYLLDPQHKDIKLEWGKVQSLVFTDHKKPGLTITKVDEQTGEPLADAHFRVESLDSNGYYYEGATGANGQIHLDNLPEGVYEITETAAPDGYIIANHPKQLQLLGDSIVNVQFTNRKKPVLVIVKLDEQTKTPLAGAKFKVQKTESGTVSEYVTGADGSVTIPNLDEAIYSIDEIVAPQGYLLDPQHKDIKLEWGKTHTVVFTDQKKPTLTIIKYDELTNQPLAGASFRLWRTEGETWSETQVTGADGKYTWTDLDAGIYSIQEIDEPYGYFKDPARKEILFNGDDNKTLEFFNRPRPVLTILKRDAITGEPIKDVKFKVQRLEGETIGEFLTDANGKIELSPSTGYLLTEEIYRVTEITPPNEYLLDTNNVKDVKLKWYEPTELIFENLFKPTLIFIKRDGMSGRGISGATYKVEYESPTGGITSLGTYKTKCGLIVLPHVLPGWYSLTETIAAPGYSLPTNPTQRLHLAPGENSYTYEHTIEDLYVDDRTNPNKGTKGGCEDCGYLCGQLCGGNCGTSGNTTGNENGGDLFGGMTITNGKGEPIGGTTPTTPVNPTLPTITAGTVTRVSNLSATVQFSSSAAGNYYYSVVNAGANEPTIATGGLGSNCTAGQNTITVYLTSGAKDLYIKVKDTGGNVSNALKISVPAYTESTPETPVTPSPTPEPETTPSTSGGIIYLNPNFPGIIITIGTQP